MTQLFANNISTTLNGAITAVATSIVVTSGTGMPSPSDGDYFLLTITDGTNTEIVKCTSRAGEALTVVRAQEGTTGFAFADLDAVELRWTAAVAQNTAKKTEAQSFSGGQSGAETTLTDGTTITPDFSLNNRFKVDALGGNRTLANPTNLVAGQSGRITVLQDATGTRVLAYGSLYKNTQTLTTTALAADILPYETVDIGGTVYVLFGAYIKNILGV